MRWRYKTIGIDEEEVEITEKDFFIMLGTFQITISQTYRIIAKAGIKF